MEAFLPSHKLEKWQEPDCNLVRTPPEDPYSKGKGKHMFSQCNQKAKLDACQLVTSNNLY